MAGKLEGQMFDVICIVGPTAVGKTKLGIELAKMLGTDVLSGDAMQIYKGLDIGTAKVSELEMEQVRHHLIDERQPSESYSVRDYQVTVRAKIEELRGQGKVPLIVGGTGLYVKSVLYDYEFTESARRDCQYEGLTNEELHERLSRVDPSEALVIHPNNRKRVVRALNIFDETKERKSELIGRQERKLVYNALVIGLTDKREALYGRINARVDKMVEAGLVEEVRCLYETGVPKEAQAIQAIGYKELYAYFDGELTQDAAVELIKRNSRRLAKRQYTWFNNQMDVTWFNVNACDFDATVRDVKAFLLE